MKHKVDDEFISICQEIINENKTETVWSEIESDNMFQTENYVGGFDSTETTYCFSVYIDDREY